MKKVGILTFHRAHNYGSVLQAYALKETIGEIKGFECMIINFIPPNQERYHIFLRNNSIKNVVKNIRSLLNYKLLKKKKELFDVFIREKLRPTEETYTTAEEIQVFDKDYYAIVCGSDQIWNPAACDFHIAYFMPYNKKVRKIAYAPSINRGEFSQDVKMQISNALESFASISTREYRGQHLLELITGKAQKIEVVLDPSLLLTAESYNQFCSTRRVEGNYIFFYSVDFKSEAVEMVHTISKQLGMPVYVVFTTNKTYKIYHSKMKISQDCGVGDFLSLIRYAKLVLTTSFHGTAFSVIYRKQFFALYGNEDKEVKVDPRIHTLLDKIDLGDREVSADTLRWVFEAPEINYSTKEAKIIKERSESIQFLHDALKV